MRARARRLGGGVVALALLLGAPAVCDVAEAPLPPPQATAPAPAPAPLRGLAADLPTIWAGQLPAAPPPAEAWPAPAARLPAQLPALLLLPDAATPEVAVVVLLPDAAPLADRLGLYAPALLDAGLAVLAIDPEAARGVDPDGPAEAILYASVAEALQDLRTALRALRRGEGLPMPLRPARIGLLGLGSGGEAALLAAHPRALGAEAPAGFDAIAAITPSCGPALAAAIDEQEAPGPAPLLLVQPWTDRATPEANPCAPLSDAEDPALRERVAVLGLDWPARYGFDLPSLGPRSMLPHPSGEGLIEAQPDPRSTALTLEAVAAFFRLSLAP